MSRSPFAYPMVRNVDGDAGGAADLQTDIMRFMAILALCLMAIFALVQSIPLAPAPQVDSAPVEAAVTPRSETEPVAAPTMTRSATEPAPAPAPAPDETVVLTRPKWKSTFKPSVELPPPPLAEARPAPVEERPDEPVAEPVTAPEPVLEEPEGFTLRFESDQALMRLVATSQVALYAISNNRARRMSVSESRISFWDASTPNEFHEMEAHTVPAAVVNALARHGSPSEPVAWGVTLPGKLKTRLDTLMSQHRGGSLVIGKDGDLRLETS